MVRKVYASIDSGFQENNYINIDIMNDDIKTIVSESLQLTSDQKQQHVGWRTLVGNGDAQCNTDSCFHRSQWNTITTIFWGFIYGKNFRSKFDRFIQTLSAIWKFDFSSFAIYAQTSGPQTKTKHQELIDSLRDTIYRFANPPKDHISYNTRWNDYPTPKQVKLIQSMCKVTESGLTVDGQ